MSTSKNELIAYLKAHTHLGGAIARMGENSPDRVHEIAENMLLEIIGDEELTKAWKEASECWWYA